MKYSELDLKQLREDNGLDFAHFTYLRHMCSCCYSPLDFPLVYWHNKTKPSSMEGVQYLLFKNASNGNSGIKTRNDEIQDKVYVSWGFPMSKLHKVCADLQGQLTPDYQVFVPSDIYHTIVIRNWSSFTDAERYEAVKSLSEQGYSPVIDTPKE